MKVSFFISSKKLKGSLSPLTLGISLNFWTVSALAERGGTKSVSACFTISQTTFSCSFDNLSTKIIFISSFILIF